MPRLSVGFLPLKFAVCLTNFDRQEMGRKTTTVQGEDHGFSK
jgi:hypothetical protein